ncbi:hypothetical protein LINGRAPRIM_LOCUS311 [Linum grandiflorum]
MYSNFLTGSAHATVMLLGRCTLEAYTHLTTLSHMLPCAYFDSMGTEKIFWWIAFPIHM